MGWFRTKRVAVAWVALLALACQFVLSYGHVHSSLFDTGKFSSAHASYSSVALALAADDGGSAIDPSAPPQKSPTGILDFCAICASIGLAGTLLMPDAPSVAAPTSSIHALPWSLVAVEPVSVHHLFFDARGPPEA
jgi:hypothetical protein